MDRPVEAGALRSEMLADLLVLCAGWAGGRVVVRVDRRLWSQDLATRPVEGDPPVVAPQGATADPCHLTHRAELVEEPRGIAGEAGREHVTLEDRGRDRYAGQLVDDLGQPFQRCRTAERPRIGARPSDRRDAVPGREESAECCGIHRFDLAAESCQRSAPEQPENVRIAPFAFRAAWPELSAEQAPG